jgi:hypothetical protein
VETPKLTISDIHRQTLQESVIDASGPGTILHDFGVFLDYVRGHELAVSKVNELPPLPALREMNALLAHPVQLGLKRPQLKSYPHLQGLYLLLRASGLATIGGTGSKPTLVVDDAVYQAWSDLNLTERYFALLEIWLLRGRPEIVGERGRGYSLADETYRRLVEFVARIPEEGVSVADGTYDRWSLSYTPGLYNLALCELFGLITVQHAEPIEGEGWQIGQVRREPFGDALLALLAVELFFDWDKLMDLEESLETPGVLQPIVQPFFPEWRNVLGLSEWTFQDGVYVFKVSLGRVWRRIAIPAKLELDALAYAILGAYDFDSDHLYEFFYRNRFGAWESVKHPYIDEGPWTDETRVGDVPLRVGQTMTYLFDFGDNWRFDVTLERVDPVDAAVTGPKLLESRGEAPEQYPNWDE